MKLQQIKLSGFKSFVDSTTIIVNSDLVGIVGPNGCGKSNVIDAVRWVLGEASAKQLRGDSMQDVIFNGSTTRKAVSRASVELVFDNSTQSLSGLWNNYNEISIKRLLTRQGESIYYINNQIVRRKDITELFLGTGLGSKGYAVIEQGMISRIIDARPEDLRSYLEEASGVSKYREKRKETLARLQDTRDNLVRIVDLYSELDKQIAILSAQAATALEYQGLNAELKHKQILVHLLKINQAEINLHALKLKIDSYNHELNSCNTQLSDIDTQLIIKHNEKNTEDLQLERLTLQFNALRTNLARLEERVRHKAELARRLVKDKHDLSEQIVDIETYLLELHELSAEAEDDMTTNCILLEEKQLIKEQKALAFESSAEKYRQAQAKLAEFTQKMNTAKHEAELLRNTLKHKKNQLNDLCNRNKRLEQNTPENTLDFNRSCASLEKNIAQIKLELEQLNEDILQKKNILLGLTRQKDQQNIKLNQYKSSIAGIEAKIATIQELLAKQNISVTELETLFVDGLTLTPLWDKIEVKSGYETAVAAVLGDVLGALHIGGLKQLQKIPPQKLALWFDQNQNTLPKSGTLADFVTLKDQCLSGIYTLLNQFQVFDDQSGDYLTQVFVGNIVTLTGHVFTDSHVIFNGFVEQNYILEYQNKLSKLRDELGELQQNLLILEPEHLSTQDNLLNLQHIVKDLDNNYKSKLALSHELTLEFTKQEQIYIQTRNHQKRVSEELTILKSEIEYLNDDVLSVELKLEDQEAILELSEQEQCQLQLVLAEHENTYNVFSLELQEIDTQVNQSAIDSQLLTQKLANFKKMISDKEQQIIAIKQKYSKLAKEQSEIANDDQTATLTDLQLEIGNVALKIEAQNLKIKNIDSELAQIKSAIALCQTQRQNTYEKLNQAQLKAQEQELLIQNNTENLIALNEVSLPSIEQQKLLSNNKLSFNELQQKILHLQAKIDALGLVNLKAIEDLALSEAKHSEMSLQIADLEQAIAMLERAILQIDDETRLLLNATHTKVNQAFTVYFKTLFGGGRANLELTASDILAAGLHIFAEPPGKKNSSIHLLSGGEKALTAMSLVFAFFNLNPAPFCLLDEVDAPLDDANTARFCNLVKELSNNTQFVYISHNRLTMEMAGQLIGITMQEKGISTVVSVSLIDAVNAH